MVWFGHGAPDLQSRIHTFRHRETPIHQIIAIELISIAEMDADHLLSPCVGFVWIQELTSVPSSIRIKKKKKPCPVGVTGIGSGLPANIGLTQKLSPGFVAPLGEVQDCDKSFKLCVTSQ